MKPGRIGLSVTNRDPLTDANRAMRSATSLLQLRGIFPVPGFCRHQRLDASCGLRGCRIIDDHPKIRAAIDRERRELKLDRTKLRMLEALRAVSVTGDLIFFP
jgi:hypothetical protein